MVFSYHWKKKRTKIRASCKNEIKIAVILILFFSLNSFFDDHRIIFLIGGNIEKGEERGVIKKLCIFFR
jgi:hypothetical protein